jgi:hypothetical protein
MHRYRQLLGAVRRDSRTLEASEVLRKLVQRVSVQVINQGGVIGEEEKMMAEYINAETSESESSSEGNLV